ncbi:MAG: CDP-alcohol phosphatidyltransferase family protein [Pseudomonadota bacterium]
MHVALALRWIPNAISLLRIAMVPLVIASIATERYSLAAGLFFVAGFSDGIDGFLARRFGWHTELGAILDPIADKLLLIGTFIMLAWVGIVPAWLAVAIIARDVVIMSGAIAYHFLHGDLEGKPSLISKLNTALLLLYVIFVLLSAAALLPAAIAQHPSLHTVLPMVLVVTLVVSTLGYMREWIRRAREHQQ